MEAWKTSAVISLVSLERDQQWIQDIGTFIGPHTANGAKEGGADFLP
jgi:hypothetical protein